MLFRSHLGSEIWQGYSPYLSVTSSVSIPIPIPATHKKGQRNGQRNAQKNKKESQGEHQKREVERENKACSLSPIQNRHYPSSDNSSPEALRRWYTPNSLVFQNNYSRIGILSRYSKYIAPYLSNDSDDDQNDEDSKEKDSIDADEMC